MAVVELDRGCLCFPDDRVQALCAQHLERATPLGVLRVVARHGA